MYTSLFGKQLLPPEPPVETTKCLLVCVNAAAEYITSHAAEKNNNWVMESPAEMVLVPGVPLKPIYIHGPLGMLGDPAHWL